MLHGLEAYMLLDSGCTSDSISPEFATSANLKVHELEEPVPLQLGTVGSCSKINFGLFTEFKLGKTEGKHYFNVVNIDRYDAILGTVFMRKHGISLDFDLDEVRVKEKPLDTIVEGESTFRQARQYAMRPQSDTEDKVFPEIVQEFTWERFPEGPKFDTPGVDPLLPSILPQEQMDNLNDILFAMCKDFAGKAKAKGPLTDKDIPRLREEWKNACQDILGGAPDHLPPLREINHHIPLVDERRDTIIIFRSVPTQ
jgi:hypothetical protein